jgi:hypothetical protein
MMSADGLRRLAAPALVLAIALAIVACTPPHVETLQRRVVPAVKAACVLIRAFTGDGEQREACATVDELAPLLAEILGAREEGAARVPRAEDTEAVAVLPTPARAVPLRRCKRWERVQSSKDGGTRDPDAGGIPGGRDATPEGGAPDGPGTP